MGHRPKVPQTSELQHQVPLGGTKHFESLLQFDIDLRRLPTTLSFILPVPERTEITKCLFCNIFSIFEYNLFRTCRDLFIISNFIFLFYCLHIYRPISV